MAHNMYGKCGGEVSAHCRIIDPPNSYIPSSNLLQIMSYNKELHQMCTKLHLPYFDTFGITARATSFDGMHYGMGINMLKAQLLLNYIREQGETYGLVVE